jgi:hypothetical protein
MYCENCGFQVSEQAKFCKSCGASQVKPPPQPLCRECGMQLAADDNFCEECGTSQGQSPVPVSQSQPQIPVPAAQPPAPAAIQHDFVVGQQAFGRYAGDGNYYSCVILELFENKASINSWNNVNGLVAIEDLAHPANILSQQGLQGNWKNKGVFYDCDILSEANGMFTVRYRMDGVVEAIGINQIRFKCPKVYTAQIHDFEDIKRKITEIYTQEQTLTKQNIDNLHFFDSVPKKKLQNAINTYAPELNNQNSDETIVWLYDDTVFGSAKDGFTLTTRRLYYRNSGGFVGCVNIEDIVEITHKKGLAASYFILRTNFSTHSFSVTQQQQREAKTTFFNVLEKTIKLLKGSDIPTSVTGEGADTAGSVIGGIFDILTS